MKALIISVADCEEGDKWVIIFSSTSEYGTTTELSSAGFKQLI